ncbi:TetR/AcrR family transcriptional regulator [Rhabdothermincola sediminis]|uniref:TetR/AcrR family transcriptional regulator n=1 Tax=Rhabdothermincola sediminis TaxID=2751370 RepID=UPI001AA02387|nr:TetR/AcrR family transcriptional regulator [Rhabdothermincola sediminis]
MSQHTEHHRPGRPRSEEADVAIFDATRTLFGELGYGALTIEQVAARAGVARSTIYRRFPNKAELVMAALEAAMPAEPLVPDTGTLEGDLYQLGIGLRELLRSSQLGAILPAAMTARSTHPELAALHERFLRRRRRHAVDAVRRGIERGEVRADVDPELLIDLVVGPVFLRALLTGGRLDDRALRRLARAAVDAHR